MHRAKKILLLQVRNFVFGAEDSLVSTVGLISGLAVADVERATILLTGTVLIFVEAFSMAVGSFLTEETTEESNGGDKLPLRHMAAGAGTMFASYFLCGYIPLSPYLLTEQARALPWSIAASLAALALLGVISSSILRTNRGKNALRMLLMGGAAIALGVLVGSRFR